MNLFCPWIEFGDNKKNAKADIKYCVDEFKEKRKNFKGNNLKFLTLLKRECLSGDHFVGLIENYVTLFQSAGLKTSDMVFAIDNNFRKKTFSKLELDNLKKATELLKPLGVKVGIYDYKDVYSYEEVKRANGIINKRTAFINNKNYSQLEKLMRAYITVSNLDYNEEDETKSSSVSRSLFGILNTNYIVCVGFSEYLKAVVNNMGDENLRVFGNSVGTITKVNNKKTYGFHRNNIVYIKDDKYKIDGFYYLDPTWDSGKNLDLAYFLIGIDEIKNIKNGAIIDNVESWEVFKKTIKATQQKNQNNYSNVVPGLYSAVSKNSFVVSGGEKYNSVNSNEYTEELLFNYLREKQDFKDFVTLKQTEKDLNNKRIKKGFDELIERNYKQSNKHIEKSNVLNDGATMIEYLKEHSPHVDIGPIQNALSTILKDMFEDATKDERSKILYRTIKKNYLKSLSCFDYGSKTAFRECEE